MKQLARIHLMAGIIFMVLTSFCSCSKYREIEYFSQKENYINVSGIVTHFKYGDRYQALYFGFSEIHLSNDITFDGQTFVDSLVTDEILHFTYSTSKQRNWHINATCKELLQVAFFRRWSV